MKWKLMVFGSGLLLLLLPFFIMLNMMIQMIGSVGATEEVSSCSEGMFTGNEKQYALLGEEDSRGVKNEVLFVVQLVEEDGQYKIDNFRYEQLHVH
ncbi:hypothetical protein [Enterococcus hirae]|uniref:hypothetical protein n=1 Tax=Enterococcus hirae TaxID=1354 RepID=UPI001929CFB0|nr:hypothetical protein [Enterococcus hirae]